MQAQTSSQINKIDLSDYDFESDIQNRLLMASFTALDVEVLEEVLHSSLKFPVEHVADAVDAEVDEVIGVLDRLAETGLLKRDGDLVSVDKEMRKYYDFQISKFEEDFEPDMGFLQGLLRKVPIHVLPNWYSIPRASQNIFESIVERFLETPRVYQRYLLEVGGEDPLLADIARDVFEAEGFQVRSCDLQEKYGLSPEAFQEQMLHLEFNFICCLSYAQFDGEWSEVVTPFHEWREYLRFLRDKCPQPVKSPESVIAMRTPEIAFASDLRSLLFLLGEGPISVDVGMEIPYTLSEATLESLTSRWEEFHVAPAQAAPYVAWIISKLLLLELAELRDGELHIRPEGEEWRKMTLEDLALALYRHRLNRCLTHDTSTCPHFEKLLREAERALQPIARSGWITFDDFADAFHAPIGDSRDVTLRKVGRKWAYVLPTHTESEKEVLREVVFERFLEAGFVRTGVLDGIPCLAVTEFGRHILSL